MLTRFSLETITFPEILIEIADNNVSGVLRVVCLEGKSVDLHIKSGCLVYDSDSCLNHIYKLFSNRTAEVSFEPGSIKLEGKSILLEILVIKGLSRLKDWSSLKDKLPGLSSVLVETGEYRSVVAELSPLNAAILKQAGTNKSLKGIARELGCSREQVLHSVYLLSILNLVEEGSSPSLRSWMPRFDLDLAWMGSFVIGSFVLLMTLNFEALAVIDLKLLDFLMANGRKQSKETQVALVTIDESDLAALGEYPLADGTLKTVLEKIVDSGASVVGADLYRNLKVGAGSLELEQFFIDHDNVFAVEKAVAGSRFEGVVPPNPVLAELGRSVLSDAVVDADGSVRRGLLSVVKEEEVILTLGARLAVELLQREGATIEREGDSIVINGNRVASLVQGNGIYQDVGGYQILLDRVITDFSTVTLSELLADDFDRGVLEGKIVILGSVAASLNDFVRMGGEEQPGVFLHGNIASQLLAIAKGEVQSISFLEKKSVFIALIAYYLLILSVFRRVSYLKTNKFKIFYLLSVLGSILVPYVIGLILLSTSTVVPISNFYLASGIGLVSALLLKRPDLDSSFLDKTTQLPNNRYFFKAIEQSLALSRAYESYNFSLIVFKINGFKVYSEVSSVSSLIQAIVEIIEKVLQDVEYLIARLNPDRLGLYIPQLDQQGALKLRRFMKDKLAEKAEWVSIGIASFCSDDYISVIEMLATADSDLLNQGSASS